MTSRVFSTSHLQLGGKGEDMRGLEVEGLFSSGSLETRISSGEQEERVETGDEGKLWSKPSGELGLMRTDRGFLKNFKHSPVLEKLR